MNTDSLKGLWKTVFGDTDVFIDTFFETAYRPDHCWYMEENGQLLSALYWLDCQWEGQKIAYIYAVATDPAHRGKGLASRLLEQTHRHLKSLGYAGAVLKPAQGLIPFYERLGYAVNSHITPVAAEAGILPVPVKQLSVAQYGAMRQRLLPENSISQEGAFLAFLDRVSLSYAYEENLICIDPAEKVVLEYLGQLSVLPAILAALGISRAQLRIPGGNVPFTMYYPLNCTKIPGYLGITLE